MKNLSTYTKRILATFDRATPSDIVHGMRWYDEAQSASKALSKAYNMPLHVVVGVIAALSPNNRWTRNIVDAEALLAGWHNGDDIENVTVCTYKTMRAKAWSILDAGADVSTEEVRSILNGQKITAFFDCIAGLDACCIDGHAYNIAMGKRETLTSDKVNVTKKMFRDLQSCYRSAAKRRGIAAYQMQAVTWIVWRNEHNIT